MIRKFEFVSGSFFLKCTSSFDFQRIEPEPISCGTFIMDMQSSQTVKIATEVAAWHITRIFKSKFFLHQLHRLSLDDCSNTCFDCSGCVAYVDNREQNPPQCVFKSSIGNLYVTLMKIYIFDIFEWGTKWCIKRRLCSHGHFNNKYEIVDTLTKYILSHNGAR